MNNATIFIKSEILSEFFEKHCDSFSPSQAKSNNFFSFPPPFSISIERMGVGVRVKKEVLIFLKFIQEFMA